MDDDGLLHGRQRARARSPRATRQGRLVALPATEALILASLASSAGGGAQLDAAAVAAARESYLGRLASGILSAARGGPAEGSGGGGGGGSGSEGEGAPPAPSPRSSYGEVAEALLRGWDVLPVGLYRRVHPATGLRASPATVAALQLAAGPPSPPGAFGHNRALLSYVYTNPPPATIIGEHDLLYVLLPAEAGGAVGEE